MKFMKKRGYDGSLRKVWSDDKEVCFGVVGGVIQKPWFGKNREDALANLPKM